MASQTDDAERRVRAQRERIEQKLNDLEGRVGDDISHARSRLQHHVTHAADLVPGGPRVIEQVEQHPIASMAGGLGIGIAAGMMGGRSSSDGRREDDDRRDYRREDRDGGAAMFLGSITNSLISPLRPYVEDAAKEVIAGFSDREKHAKGSSSFSTPPGASAPASSSPSDAASASADPLGTPQPTA